MVYRRLRLPYLMLIFLFFLAACQSQKEITPSEILSENWSKKLETAIRYNLLEGKYLEAWRITQLARSTDAKILNLKDYEALSIAKAGSCPIAIDSTDSMRKNLLSAYAYRYRTRFNGKSPSQSPYKRTNSKQIISQLEKDRNFYLADIPRAKIIKRSGCLFLKSKLDDPKLSKKHEFYHLLSWYNSLKEQPTSDYPPGHRQVLYRLFFLAQTYGDQSDKTLLVDYFKSYQEQDWLKTNEPEKTLIWDALSKNEKVFQVPLPKNSKNIELIEKIILSSKSPESSNWLGAININQQNSQKQLLLINHLLKINGVEKKNWLLNQKMIVLYRLGKTNKTLNIIRSLTVDGESENERDIEENAIYIASQLFAEFKYDRKLLGTIQSSLPSNYWIRVYRNMLIHHAIAGNKPGYQLLYQTLKSNKSLRRIRLKEKQLRLLDHLVNRDRSKFRKSISTHKNSEKKQILGLFDQLVPEIIRLSPAKRAKLTPFLQTMANYTLKNIKRANNLKKLEFLLSLLDENRKIAWNRGSQSARKGSQNLGAVNISDNKIIESKFLWDASFDTPRKELLMVPDKVAGTGWIIR